MGDLICRKSMMRCLTPGMCSPHSGCQTSILEDCDVRYAGDSGSTAVNPFGPLAGTISAEDYRRCMAERDQLKAELERVRAALCEISGIVDGNIREIVRDLVNRDAGLNNGANPNDIYEECDRIDAAIDAAMGKGGAQNDQKTAETRASAGLEGGAEGGKGGRADA